MSKHLAIACGGTGGHFYPTLAVARAFQERGGKVTLLVSGKHAAEQLQTAARYGLEAREVPSVRLPGFNLDAWRFPLDFWRCRLAARRLLRELQPNVLLGMGSFAAAPACCEHGRIPLVLHEGNAFMGKTNRWLVKRAVAVALSLPLARPGQLRGKPARVVGMPLREALVKAAEGAGRSPELLAALGLEPGRKTVLVFGGSQGATFINTLVAQTAARLGAESGRLQFIHLTGSDDNAGLSAAYGQAGLTALIRRSDPDIERCYLAADLVVCRGGASSLCELALFRKPALLIPLPTAADNHQYFNAVMAAGQQAVRYLEQKEATPERLAELLHDFLERGDSWQAMGQRLGEFARPAAAEALAAMLEEAAQTEDAGK